MKRNIFIAFIIAVVASFAFGQEKFVKPVDEAAKDASFLAFRKKVIAAAERKDVNYILSVVDRQIKNGFGGYDGFANFKRQWKITSKNSEFWQEFLAVMRNGGAFSDRGKLFTAPYTFSSWPDDIDGFEDQVIFGNNVNLRNAPSMDATVVAQLSYNIVKVDHEKSMLKNKGSENETYDWAHVTTRGGKTGFVKAEFVRSHIDYRAGFEKKRGVWKMTFFLAGD